MASAVLVSPKILAPLEWLMRSATLPCAIPVVNIFHEATELHAYFDFIPADFNFYTGAAGCSQFSFS
jgi:hypothetical protein